jgi:GcrA cell cycle regulator
MPWQLATWTDERKALVRELWAQGYSASQIGRQLDPPVTRNAVIGLCYRNEFPHGRRRHPMPSPPPLPMQNAIREADAPPRPKPKPAEPAPPAFLALPLHELTDSQCRWPEGDGPFVFCGQPVVLASPYCPDHKARANHR